MKYIDFYIKEHVAYIELNRTKAMNAFNNDMMKEFLEIFKKIEQNPSVYSVMLSSKLEKTFSAGGDVKEENQLDKDSAKAFAEKGKACVRAIENCAVPVVAAIHGYVLGAGVELILGCDIIVAADNIQLGIPTINLGGIPGLGSTQRLPKLLGKSTAADILLTGRSLTADDALRLNLVQYIVKKEELETFTFSLCKELAKKAPKAVQAIKKAIQVATQQSLESGLIYETQLFIETCLTEDHYEGTLAFLEKRPHKEFLKK